MLKLSLIQKGAKSASDHPSTGIAGSIVVPRSVLPRPTTRTGKHWEELCRNDRIEFINAVLEQTGRMQPHEAMSPCVATLLVQCMLEHRQVPAEDVLQAARLAPYPGTFCDADAGCALASVQVSTSA